MNSEGRLAQFWGIVIAVMSVGLLASRKILSGMKQSKQDYGTIFVVGLIALLCCSHCSSTMATANNQILRLP